VRNSQPKQREQQTSQEASDAEMMVKPGGRHRERSAGVVRRNDETSGSESLMEQVVARENMLAALRRVEANKGAPGNDGMTRGATPRSSANGLAAHQRCASLGYLQTASRSPGRDSQTRRWHATVGDSERCGSPDPTSVTQILTPIFDPTFS